MRASRAARLALVVVAFARAVGRAARARSPRRSAATATLAQMGWFFTKAALLTFGGAYAVLPYVFQGAVETYGWLTRAADDRRPRARRDHARPAHHGRRVRRLTSARCTHALFGAVARFAAGVAGATVATFFTFLPSFLFILAGGPLVERTHGQARFTAPLTGITAAVVGVIVNLAVFFALHVLWPDAASYGPLGGADWAALAIGMLAAGALFRLRVGVIPVILAAAAAGIVLHVGVPLLR